MDALPDDVLLLILSRFHQGKELARLELVSRRWWQLCKHVPTLTIRIPSTHSTDSADRLLESVLSGRFGLRELHISELCSDLILKRLDSSTIGKQSKLPQATSPKLSYLEIELGRLQQGLDGSLFRNLHECHLSVTTGVSNATVEALLKACPALHTLTVFCCADVQNSPLSLDSNSLQHLSMGWRQKIMQLTMPSLKELHLDEVSISNVDNGLLSCRDLHTCELLSVDGSSGAGIEALVKNCTMLHILKVRCRGDSGFRMALESTSLKDLTIVGDKEIEVNVELRTCNLEKLFLQDVHRVIVDGGALKSIRAWDSCDVDSPQSLRHLSTLELNGCWTCRLLKKVMSIANSIRSLEIHATILDAPEMSKDDFMGQFHNLRWSTSDLLWIMFTAK